MLTKPDRILTTHVGSLPRVPELRELILERTRGEEVDPGQWSSSLRSAVAEVVRRQVECGVDIVSDGEQSKVGFNLYFATRLRGVRRAGTLQTTAFVGRERELFAEFYDEYFGKHPIVVPRFVCDGPITYDPAEVTIDLKNFEAALPRDKVVDAFVPAPPAVSIENEFYPDKEALNTAMRAALREEYRAIVDAGFLLQIDDPGLAATWGLVDGGRDDYRKVCERRVTMLKGLLEGIPEEKVRYHVCWGSWHGPHVVDIPFREIVEFALQVPAQAISFEAANPRHAHEYHVWEEVELPPDKVIMPGVISHATPIVEHPEWVAERIVAFAKLVGRERVIAGSDCGFGQTASVARVHPSIVWAKLQALAEGARIATKQLWGR